MGGFSNGTRVMGGRTRPITGRVASNSDNIIRSCNVPDFNWKPNGYYIDDTFDGCLVNKKEFLATFGERFFITVGCHPKIFPSKISDLENSEIFHMSQWVTVPREETVGEFIGSLGLPIPRLENYNIGLAMVILVLYVLVFVLLIACCTQQPLKSRGIVPVISWIFQFVVYTVTTMTFYLWKIEDFTKNQHFILYFVTLNFQIMTIACTLFMFMRYVLLTSINQQKSFFSSRRNDPDAPPKVHAFFRVLKVAGTWYSTLIALTVLYSFTAIVFLCVFAACRFGVRCIDHHAYNFYIFFIVVLVILFVLTLATDIVLNRFKLKNCNFVALWKEDVYWMRAEIYPLGLLLMVPIFTVGAVLIDYYPDPSAWPVVRAVITSILTYAWIFYQMGFVLIITIISFIGRLLVKKPTWDVCEKVLHNTDGRVLFLEFSKNEYSSENNLCWEDIQEYKNESDVVQKKKLAITIFNTYLNGSFSPLEVNISQSVCKIVKEKVDTGMAPQTLFADVERALMVNLADTFSRFMFSRDYQQLEVRERFMKQTFGEN